LAKEESEKDEGRLPAPAVGDFCSMKATTPKWNPENLTRHHRERLRKDPGCFEDLLKINGRPMKESEYDLRSDKAVAKAWAKFEAQMRNVQHGEYYDRAMYFVDDELVVAVTDTFEREFVTCYHQHFGRKMAGHARVMSANAGDRKLSYLDLLNERLQGGLIVRLRWIRRV
jgi:hypothetical protein